MRGIILIAFSAAHLAAYAPVEQIRIRLVDGRNGHPVKDEQLSFRVGTKSLFTSLTPDKDGEFVVDVSRGEVIQVVSNHRYFDCRALTYGNTPSYLVDEIVDSGIGLPNKCGKIHAEPRRGEMVLYVRPFSWSERLKAEVERPSEFTRGSGWKIESRNAAPNCLLRFRPDRFGWRCTLRILPSMATMALRTQTTTTKPI